MLKARARLALFLLALAALGVCAVHCGSDPTPAAAAATPASDAATGVLPNPASALQ